MKSFTVDEIKEIFNNIVVNSNRHGNSYYTQLNGITTSQDVGYFEQCMPCFLEDLRLIASGEYDEKGNKIKKNINDYDFLREALDSMKDTRVSALYLMNNNILNSYIINTSVSDMLKDINKYITDISFLDSNSYHISYSDDTETLIIIVY